MNDFASIVNEAAEITAEQKVKEAKFDATIQAKILSCEDQSRGKYRVKYQDSIFVAYAEKESTYAQNTDVYILVPSNDFSKTKKIIGSVNNLSTDYISVVAGTEESFDKIGTDIINDTGEFALKSALSYDVNRKSITLYDAGQEPSKNLITVDEKVASEYMSKAEYFIMAANFRTDLAESQKTNGTYTYRITIQYEDKASGNIKYRDHELSSLEMTGQPYTFINKTRQFKAFQYTDFKYIRISKIVFLCDNFPKGVEIDDLFISDLEMYAAKPIPQEDLTSYHISLSTPQGSIFIENTATKSLPIIATFKINGKVVDSSTLDIYWFLQDNTITTNSERYHPKGGIGWRCINNYTDIIDENGTKVGKNWITKGIDKYIVQKNSLPVEYSTFKCVIPYEDVNTLAYQEIINRDHVYTVKIECDQIVDGKISWYNDEGTADLKCVTRRSDVEITDNLTYSWGKTDAYGNTVPINPEVDPNDYAYWVDYVSKADEYIANNPGVFYLEQYPYYDEYSKKIAAYEDQTRIDGQWLRNVKAIDIDTMATYTVTVTWTNQDNKESMVIGTDKVIITNGKSTGGYILSIEKPPLYKYDANGISPANDSKGSQKITIDPLKFILVDSSGNVLSDSTIAANFNIKWTYPAIKTMIVNVEETAILTEDETEYILLNKTQLAYAIADTFSVGKNNNTVKLELTNKDDNSIYLQAYVTLLFTKEGGIGTNGTEYSITIDLIQSKVNDFTDRTDIPIVKIINYNISPAISPVNFTTSGSKWLKFAFWKNGEKIFEGIDSNTIPGYDGLVTTEGKKISNLKWQMLSKNSYYAVNNLGDFSSSGRFELNPCNIVKISFNYNGIYYSSCLPIITILVDNNNYLSAPQLGGFIEAIYGPDGANPQWDQTNPFIIKSLKETDVDVFEDVTDIVEYKWELGGEIPNLSFENDEEAKNKKWVTPDDILTSSKADNSVIISIGEKEWQSDITWQNDHPMDEMTEEEIIIYDEFLLKVDTIKENLEYTEEEKENMIQAEFQNYKNLLPFYVNVYNTIHFPIHMLINRYSSTAINDWDGNIYTLNEDNDVLLVPQIGAGRKESDNSFTGMIMGTINVKKKNISDVGLFGYSQGERTFFLDGNTGKVELGIKSSKIIIDPSTDRLGNPQASIQANYSKINKTGMYIDLINPSIKYGNEMFSVDEDGRLFAQEAEISGKITADELNANGCFVGNFEISKAALLMNASLDYRNLYYDWEEHEWLFDKEEINEETNEVIQVDQETIYKRMRASADIYFGALGLNIGKVNEEENDPKFQVTTDGSMFCKKATILDALTISSDNLQGARLTIAAGGSILFENGTFEVDSEGVGYIKELRCDVLYADAINPETIERTLVGPNLVLNDGAYTYCAITKEKGIEAPELKILGDLIEGNELNINNNCRIYSNGLILAKQLEVNAIIMDELKFTTDKYIFSSSAELGIEGKDLGNILIDRGKVFAFTNENIGEDLTVIPRIIGWVPVDNANNIIFDEQPCLELASGYRILLNASQYIDFQIDGEGKFSFMGKGISSETGEEIIETYAELNTEGLKLHEGGDTLVSMLDGTYNIPYPPNQYYDKIFTLDDYLFKAIYIDDPSEAQGIDLTPVFGSLTPDEISVQLCISIDLKGITTSVSEIIEEDGVDETVKTVRNFYINYNRIPTKEEFGNDAIKMHWTAFFFKKN